MVGKFMVYSIYGVFFKLSILLTVDLKMMYEVWRLENMKP